MEGGKDGIGQGTWMAENMDAESRDAENMDSGNMDGREHGWMAEGEHGWPEGRFRMDGVRSGGGGGVVSRFSRTVACLAHVTSTSVGEQEHATEFVVGLCARMCSAGIYLAGAAAECR